MYSNDMLKQIIKRIIGESEQEQPQQVPEVTKAKPDIFESIYGLDVTKRLVKRAIHASSPVSFLLTGPPGLAKSAIAKAIETAYPNKTIYMDGTGLTAAGIKKQVKEFHEDLQREMFVIVDEIEKADKSATNVFLNIIEGGRLTKTMATESYDIKNLRVSLIATCNDFERLKKNQPALVDRIMIINIQKPTTEEFLAICQMRLVKEGVSAEVALYIGSEIHKTFGPDMREAVRVSKMAKTPADVDEVIADLKSVGIQ